MSAEVRTLREGFLWWVQASGSGIAWATASAPTSGLFGYVQSMDYTSGMTYTVVYERGIPHHRKANQNTPITVNANVMWSGSHPTAVSGSGASVPMFHLEHQANAPENGGTGRFHQFHGVVIPSYAWTESMDGNTMAFTMEALAMNGPTASGYLSS